MDKTPQLPACPLRDFLPDRLDGETAGGWWMDVQATSSMSGSARAGLPPRPPQFAFPQVFPKLMTAPAGINPRPSSTDNCNRTWASPNHPHQQLQHQAMPMLLCSNLNMTLRFPVPRASVG